MHDNRPVAKVIDLLDPSRNTIFSHSPDQARKIVREGTPEAVRSIDGHFAIVAQNGRRIRMARTIGRLMRYFIAKRVDGPQLVVADRIDAIQHWLKSEGLGNQFHPSYTRMVPAHYVVELELLGCPDPNPTYRRYFTPPRGTLPADLDVIGRKYIEAVDVEISKWLERLGDHKPIGVCFSGGIDSGAVFVLTYHAMLRAGMNPSRLKAFTLSVDGGGGDLVQAREMLKALNLDMFHEPIEVTPDAINVEQAIRVVEDYKPLDVQAGAMTLALCRGIRNRYPDWKYLIDGDGGDENLKDYPIEENPELTIRSVLNNMMLYQEGWGVDSIKHSLTFSGGQSRGYARVYGPTTELGFSAFSPFTSPPVIAVAEAIPFIDLTGWDHEQLYRLKGEIVSRGIRHVTGMDMPIFEKRRFQHGVMNEQSFTDLFPSDERSYRRLFDSVYA